METDIRTGRPLDPKKNLEDKERELRSAIAEGITARNDLLSPDTPGNLALRSVLDALIVRVDELMSTDPVCIALQQILVSVGGIVYRGPEVASRKLAQFLGEEFSRAFSAPKRRDTGTKRSAAPRGTPAKE